MARAEEAARKAAEDAAAAEAAAEARKARQTEKKATQKERSRLRALCAGMGDCPGPCDALHVSRPQDCCPDRGGNAFTFCL